MSDSATATRPAAGSPLPQAAAVEAVFVAPDGTRVQRRWCQAAVTVRLEDLVPVAPFPVAPGRRWGPGWWWSATTARHVAHGSKAMRTQLMLLDRDPHVVALAARPVRLIWRDPGNGQVRTWIPQLFARYADGSGLLADCPVAPAAGGAQAQRAAAVLDAACSAVGFAYRRLVPPDPVVAANTAWLAGYRHPRHRDAFGLQRPVLDAFACARPLADGVAAVGDALAVLPVVYHALWNGKLSAELTRPLGEHTLIGPGPADHTSSDGERHRL